MSRLLIFLNLCIIFLLAFVFVKTSCQNQEERQTIRLTPEMIESLRQVISLDCEAELNELIRVGHHEMSPDCQVQLDEAVRNSDMFQKEYPKQQTSGYNQNNKREQNSEDPDKEPTPVKKESGFFSPIVLILLFIGTIIALVAYAVVTINNQLKNRPAIKPKKISKKKEEKQRNKAAKQPPIIR
jgi:hypothetical protein